VPVWLCKAHYLGHITGQASTEPEKKKITAVRDYLTPVTKRDVHAF